MIRLGSECIRAMGRMGGLIEKIESRLEQHAQINEIQVKVSEERYSIEVIGFLYSDQNREVLDDLVSDIHFVDLGSAFGHELDGVIEEIEWTGEVGGFKGINFSISMRAYQHPGY